MTIETETVITNGWLHKSVPVSRAADNTREYVDNHYLFVHADMGWTCPSLEYRKCKVIITVEATE